MEKEQICWMYVITKSGACTLTTSTKLQNKYRSTLYQHEIKEKRRLLPILSSLISWLRLLSNPWNLTRLGSHDWTGEGLRQSGWVPLIPAWDSALCWDTKEAPLSERGFSWGPQQQETWRLGEFQGPRGQSVRPPSFGCTRIYGASQGKPLRG